MRENFDRDYTQPASGKGILSEIAMFANYYAPYSTFGVGDKE